MNLLSDAPLFLAAGLEQMIVIALVGIGIAIKNYFENRANKKKNEKAPAGTFGGPAAPPAQSAPHPAAPRPSTAEEEKMRKFFEALGLPVEAVPPAPVAPKRAEPPPPPARKVPPPMPPPVSKRLPPPPPPPPIPPSPYTEARSLDSDPSPSVLAGDMHRVDPKFEHATVMADFRGAASLTRAPVDVHVDVRPDLIGKSPGVVEVPDSRKRAPAVAQSELSVILRGDRAALRRALVLNEVLGKPVGLRD